MDNEVEYRIRAEGHNIVWFITFDSKAPTNEHGRFSLYGRLSAESSSLVTVVDALCQLLAWHKTLSEVQLKCPKDFASWPVSVTAIETLVGQAKSPRILDIDDHDVPLSAEQCQALAFGCNENIKLIVNASEWMGRVAFLTKGLTLNRSPTRLCIRDLGSLPKDLFYGFLVAVENNTPLMELDVRCLERLSTFGRVVVFRAIGRNNGLQCLNLEYARLSDTEWKIIWEESLSRHPTIRTLNIKHTVPHGSDMQRRDEVIVRSIRSNGVLSLIEYNEVEHSPNIMREEVLPILQFNRFRPLVVAIKQEVDQALRCRMFTMTLLHDQVRNRPAIRYLLLNENPDVLLQCIRTRQKLLCRRHQLVEQFDGVVGETDDCGMSLPSSMANSALFTRKRKR